jgi:hypothetical protein
MSSFLVHPLTTFGFGILCTLLIMGFLLTSCSGPNHSAAEVEEYEKVLKSASDGGPAAGSAAEEEAREAFTNFLKNVGSKDYIAANTSQVYAPNAYLNDTLVTHYGPEEIEKYFLETADKMTEFQVSIDDVMRSGDNHYFRWTMIFAAPAMAGGEPIHSIGMSQVRFNNEGKVVMHQDFWDSGSNFFGKLPLSGPAINFIRKRLQ